MSTSFVLINSDLGKDIEIIASLKQMLESEKDLSFEIQGVYGVYDIILKISSDDSEKILHLITEKIRKIKNVQSTLTMAVIEEQEKT